MKIKFKEEIINKEDPFNPSDDILNRKPSADILTEVINSVNEPFVLSIDSPWGTGKTTFINRWRYHLINHGYPTILYNAWENDFSNNPLASILSEIDLGIRELKGIDDNSHYGFAEVKEIGTKLIKLAIPLGVKVLTAGIIDASGIQQCLGEFSKDSILDLTEKFASNEIKEYELSKENLKDFKTKLGNFVTRLKNSNDYKDKPLIILIDELDRCRPNFAIEVLEKIKHFFSIEGIIFVLAIDRNQIYKSIQSVYGLEMNIDGYYDRFIDLNFSLPYADHEKFFDYLFNKHELEKFQSNIERNTLYVNDWEVVRFIFTTMSKIFDIPLRRQIISMRQLTLALKTIPPTHRVYPSILTFLIMLKFVNRELYFEYLNGTASFIKIIEFLEKNDNTGIFKEREYYTATLHILLCKLNKNKNEVDEYIEIQRRKSESDSYSYDEKEEASTYISIFNSIRVDVNFLRNYIFNKIELLEQFYKSE